MDFGYAIPQNVLIRPTGNKGFIVEIGSREFSFTSSVDLRNALDYYFMDPERAEKEFHKATQKSPLGKALESLDNTLMASGNISVNLDNDLAVVGETQPTD